MASEDEEIRLEAENLDLRRSLAKAGIDAEEHEVVQKLQRVLLEEMHHRIKNVMATVQSITNLSLRAAHSVEEARLAIQSRLSALGRVHDLLLQANWSKAKLGAILSTAIEPFEATAGRKFIIRIPDIDVAPAVALPIALILNELCTNAVKYGALSTPAGRVEIAASAGNGKFMLAWAEFNGPRVEKPERRSFGSTLIERAFVAQLRGNARLDFEPAGVRYQLEVPVAVLLAGPSD